VCEVSEHLQPFYLKHGICQLTDHEYDMRYAYFCKILGNCIIKCMLRCIVLYDTSVRAV
jgi:hypothetical protein